MASGRVSIAGPFVRSGIRPAWHTAIPCQEGNCSDSRGSADYSAYCGGAIKHGISTANRVRPLKREQLPKKR